MDSTTLKPAKRVALRVQQVLIAHTEAQDQLDF
jgi:hypothetical protein